MKSQSSLVFVFFSEHESAIQYIVTNIVFQRNSMWTQKKRKYDKYSVLLLSDPEKICRAEQGLHKCI